MGRGEVGKALNRLNQIIKKPYKISDHNLILGKRGGQSIKVDTLFKSENLADCDLPTSMNSFFGGQHFESKNILSIFVKKHTVPDHFFLKDQDFEHSVITFRDIGFYFPLIAQGMNKT